MATAGSKILKSIPIETTGTMSQPWTVMADREVIMATPSWVDPTASEPPLAPEIAIRKAEEFIRTKGFEKLVASLRVTVCDVFSPKKWYYVATYQGDRESLLNNIGCDSVVILMDGTILNPVEGRLAPVYERR